MVLQSLLVTYNLLIISIGVAVLRMWTEVAHCDVVRNRSLTPIC
jgi:hypothetical protein